MSKWGGAPRFASLRLTLFWGFGNTNRDSFCFFIVDIIYVNASNEEKIKKGAFGMSYEETDNTWMVCLNCETEFSVEELFASEEDDLTECPVCGQHAFRKCDSYGTDLENEYRDFNYNYGEW